MKTLRSDGQAGRVLGIAPSYDQMMRGIGAVATPGWVAGEPYQEMSKRCRAYAAELAADRLISGKPSTLDQLQADEDACRDSLGFKRNLLQIVMLSAGLGIAGYVGFRLVRR